MMAIFFWTVKEEIYRVATLLICIFGNKGCSLFHPIHRALSHIYDKNTLKYQVQTV